MPRSRPVAQVRTFIPPMAARWSIGCLKATKGMYEVKFDDYRALLITD